MSEPDPTGYRESPDTTDGPVAPGHEQMEDVEGADGQQGGVSLTTDSEAQRDDSVMRPGNEPD
jgi:hypothetical protein